MDYKVFFNKHPVFTIDEFLSSFKKAKMTSVYSNLKYYLKKGRLRIIKRGVYYVIPEESSSDKFYPDSLLVASRLSKDAVIGFHSALELMGYAHSVFHRFFYYTDLRKRIFKFKDDEFISVKIPERLKKNNSVQLGIKEEYYHNAIVRFTNRERTFVDCLDRPEFGGGIEEVYRCVEKYPYLNFDEIMAYLDALGKNILYAKTGVFLQQHREQFFVEEELLKELKKRAPVSAVYFDSERKKGKLVKEWNLMVPDIIIKRGWEEF
ncbi:MAG: type IV toxin-antitoxin system AbiEi family antitoxin domain-containing protein [bacterium]